MSQRVTEQAGRLAPAESISIGPFAITPVPIEEAQARIEGFIHDGGHHYVCFCEANLLSHGLDNRKVARIVDRADLSLPDGIAPALLAEWSGGASVSRVPGPAFMLEACEHGVSRGWRHFFYGGAPGVADRLAERLGDRFPGLEVAGTLSPPFRPLLAEENAEVKRVIEAGRTDLLWVGLGGPKQEIWMSEQVGKIDVPVMLGVGAAFDFHSGNRSWAPGWIRALGLEWWFRMLTGGWRVLFRNVRCVTRVGAFMLRRKLLRRGSR